MFFIIIIASNIKRLSLILAIIINMAFPDLQIQLKHKILIRRHHNVILLLQWPPHQHKLIILPRVLNIDPKRDQPLILVALLQNIHHPGHPVNEPQRDKTVIRVIQQIRKFKLLIIFLCADKLQRVAQTFLHSVHIFYVFLLFSSLDLPLYPVIFV